MPHSQDKSDANVDAADSAGVEAELTPFCSRSRKPSWLRRPTFHVDTRDIVLDELSNGQAPSSIGPVTLRDRLIVAVCGLPARGKSFISNKVGRYMNWIGVRTRVFHQTKYRREEFGPYQKPEFFDYSDRSMVAKRACLSQQVLQDIFAFFQEGGQLAVLNSHNVSLPERKLVTDFVKSQRSVVESDILWIETVCDDEELVERNILAIEQYVNHGARSNETGGPTIADEYRQRIRYYNEAYTSVENDSISYIKFYSPGHKLVINRVEGYVQSKIISYLSNLSLVRHPLFISRHGESLANLVGHIGGDSGLSERGHQYGEALGEFFADREQSLPGLKVWTSTMLRAVETASYVDHSIERTQWPALAEISSGIFQGMTYDDIKESRPDEYIARKRDKLRYRYPQGESYLDVIRRVEPIIFELERTHSPMLLVSHKAVLRCICSYFLGIRRADMPTYEFPPHAVIELTPHPYGFEVTRYDLDVEHAEANGSGHTDS